jgi:hypothetical protein
MRAPAKFLLEVFLQIQKAPWDKMFRINRFGLLLADNDEAQQS